jgi:hypothetical protein
VRVLVATAAAAVATMCAACAADRTQELRVAPADAPLPVGGPTVNWDKPIPDGQDVDLGEAKSAGHLRFDPQLPAFGRSPVRIQVADPADFHAIAFVFHFPTGGDFGSDGRVRVLESDADISEEQLFAVAADPPGPQEDFSVITLGTQRALLVQSNGVGRVQFIRDGVEYDVSGATVTPAGAESLASKL